MPSPSQAGAVFIVAAAIVVAFVITLVALPGTASADRTTLVTGAFTLIGTLVGSYVGVRVGSRGVDEARAEAAAIRRAQAESMEEETIRTAELAGAISDPGLARRALDRAEEKISQRRGIEPAPATSGDFDDEIIDREIDDSEEPPTTESRGG